jgi:hypothetical protein
LQLLFPIPFPGRKKKVGNEVTIQTPDLDDGTAKARTDELASEAEQKSKGFFNRVEKKLNHVGGRAEDAAKQGQKDAQGMLESLEGQNCDVSRLIGCDSLVGRENYVSCFCN